MVHPLEFIPQKLRPPFFYFFLALTLLIFGIFNHLDAFLRNDSAPMGMISFELAYRADSAQGMVDSWNSESKLAAAFALGLDYLFMPVYALALSLGLMLARGQNSNFYDSLANWMSWAAFLAALLDAVENYALWQVLTQGAFLPYPQTAAICAAIKFTLLILGLVTALAGKFIRK